MNASEERFQQARWAWMQRQIDTDVANLMVRVDEAFQLRREDRIRQLELLLDSPNEVEQKNAQVLLRVCYGVRK